MVLSNVEPSFDKLSIDRWLLGIIVDPEEELIWYRINYTLAGGYQKVPVSRLIQAQQQPEWR